MYVLVPTNVSAIELISSPETPKSHILISPLELHNMFDGLISTTRSVKDGIETLNKARTSVNDPVYVV